MQAHLARIEQVNPQLNALVEVADPEKCLETADDADNRRHAASRLAGHTGCRWLSRLVDFSLSEARSRFAGIDTYRIELLTFMADYDVIVCPAMPTAAKPTTTVWSRSATSPT